MAAPKPKEVLQQLTRRVTDAEAKVDAHYALIALGRSANDRGDFRAALEAFEAAFKLQPECVAFVSAANMRLKLGQTDVAKELYSYILTQSTMQLSASAEEVAVRKLRQIESEANLKAKMAKL